VISIEPGSGPTVRRILLGTQLRRLRESRGITREEAGYRIRASESKISRMELGRVGFKERDVVDLLAMYGVDDESERDALVELARSANAPGWWHQYADVLPDWFQTYVGLEEAASVLRVYEVQFVPGLRARGDDAWLAGRAPGGDRAPRQHADHQAGTADQAGRPAPVGRRGRGGAAAPSRQR
jgi:transcriptional regulator with XRE-family HTH domain